MFCAASPPYLDDKILSRDCRILQMTNQVEDGDMHGALEKWSPTTF